MLKHLSWIRTGLIAILLLVLCFHFAGMNPVAAATMPLNITGTIDTGDPAFDTNKTLLDCNGVWMGTNWRYETRTLTVDGNASINIRDQNNGMPGNPNANDASYGVYDVTSTPFNASNLPLTSQCLGAATNNLNVSLTAGRTYVLVITGFNAASGVNYDLRVTGPGHINLVIGSPGVGTPTAPTITSITASNANGTYGPGAVINVQVNFSEPVQYGSIGVYMTLGLGNGTTAVCYCAGYPTPASSTYTFQYTVTSSTTETTPDLDNAAGTLNLNMGTLRSVGGTDVNLNLPAPGSANSLAGQKNIVIDTTGPRVTNVTSSTANGAYRAGSVISIQVVFDEVVNVTGAPSLSLNSGGGAGYVFGSGTNTLSFTYTVAAGQNIFDLDYTAFNALTLPFSATLRDAIGNNADRTLPLPGAANSLGANKALVIDTNPPTIMSVNSSTANGTYGVGATIAIQMMTNEDVTVGVGGTPTLALNSGGSASYTSGSGTNNLNFSYVVGVGQNTGDLNHTSFNAVVLITDPAGNILTNTLPAAPNSLGAIKSIVIDTAGPQVVSVTATNPNGNYATGSTITLQATFNETVTVNTVGGTPTLALNSGVGATATYTGGSGTATLSFSYTAALGHSTPDLDYAAANALSLNGATLRDAVNNDATLTLPAPGAANSLGANKNINIFTPVLSIDSVSLTEGDSGTTAFTFTVSLSPASNQTVTVNYATADGTATAGFDYTAASGTLTFTPGTTSQPITVQVTGDLNYEANESFTVNLSGAVLAQIQGGGQGTGTINNDDASLSINDVTLSEGNSGTTTFTFTVTRVGGSTTTVDYATADDLATAGSDYTATSGTLTFNPGDTTRTISVAVTGDTVVEGDETFFVNLSNPSTGANISDGQGTGTIQNEDASLSIGDVTLTEGNSGPSLFTFTLTRSGSTSGTTTVEYATADGSASVAAGDYAAAFGTVTFNPGDTTQTIDISVGGDATLEPDENFFINLSNPTGAIISDNQATGTIQNDDNAPGFSIGDASVVEGNAGTTTLAFTVVKIGDSSLTHTVNFATADGSAVAGSDYTSTSGTLSFDPSTSIQTINVTVQGEINFEADETVLVDLGAPSNGATLSDGQGTGTIQNDDSAAGLSISDASIVEGNAGSSTLTFTVLRGGDTTGTTTVDYTTADGSATTADNDYVAASGTLTFAANEVSQTISVTVNGDVISEGDETFTLTLSNPGSPATISTGTAIGTITNDEPPPGISVADVTVQEDAGSGLFTISLNPVMPTAVTVDYAIYDGTALAGTDYDAVLSGTLTFNAGETSQLVAFVVYADPANQPNRTFTLELTNSNGPAISRALGTATITDKRVAPATVVVEIPAPPPAPACNDVNFDPESSVRTAFEVDADRAGLICRSLADHGTYYTWYGSPLTTSGNIGNQTVLDLGVVAAVDVMGNSGFQGGVAVCLEGSGYMIYLNAANSPRIPQLWSTWTTPSFPGFTCTTIYAPGTVVLVSRAP
jgi:hypothetical protein